MKRQVHASLIRSVGLALSFCVLASSAAAEVKTGFYNGNGAAGGTITGVGFRPKS